MKFSMFKKGDDEKGSQLLGIIAKGESTRRQETRL